METQGTIGQSRVSATQPDLPVGTVTFLMTDIEGSTRVWDASPRVAKEALQRHDRIVVEQVEKNQGQTVEAGREGDSILAVFRQATDAVACALDMQRALQRESWPESIDMRVRVVLHTGEADLRAGHYVGAPLYRCARLMAISHGGQVLMTRATEEIVADSMPPGSELHDLGLHRLRDLSRPEHVFQLRHPDLQPEFPPLRSPQANQTNLPQQLTRFIGREAQLAELRKLIKTTRLITLIGPGGIGKSRLAIQLANSVSASWPDGVWWVDLTPIDEPGQVIGTIATALHLESGGGGARSPVDWFASKRAILVLDNCEHVVGACAAFCRQALNRCPDLVIVATSREPLGVDGEARWPVPPLDPSDAAVLFENRGRLVEPGFSLTTANRSAVDAICEKLDELPLAIELAASRLAMMTERQIANQLDDRFRLLAVARSADPRHQTMTAAIDWSYRLLTHEEATLFRRLSVYRGGFSFEAADAICRDETVRDVLTALSGLIEKSMVAVERLPDGQSRYRLLESQLAYAADKFRSSDESNAFQKRHYEYFSSELSKRTGGVAGPGSVVFPSAADNAWKRRELGNLWAAARWARDNREDLGIGFAGEIGFIATVDVNQARAWLAELLDKTPDRRDGRVTALSAATMLAYWQADFAASARYAQRIVDMIVPDPNRRWKETKAMALNQLGHAMSAVGHLDAAESAYLEGIALVEDATNRRPWISLRHSQGVLALERGQFTAARDILNEALAAAEQHDAPGSLSGLTETVANADLACGDVEAAERRWKQSLSMSRDLDIPSNAIACIGGLSRVATTRQDHARALRLAAAHHRLCDQWAIREDVYWQRELDKSREASRAELGPIRADIAFSQGLGLTLERAIEYALDERNDFDAASSPLSRREVEVAELLVRGMTNRQIGAKLFLSERTVEGHVDRIRQKLDLRTRSEIAAWAVEHGLKPHATGD